MERIVIPGGPALHRRIDRLRLGALQSEQMDDLNEAIVFFNDELTAQYEKQDLWATPAWHKLIGSSQQEEVFSSDKIDEITEKITRFVEAKEVELNLTSS